ncbi:MAG: hypothetical protein ISR96_06545 [Nitrospira sp.]|nr:hypothetical protein [bacterium]MBL7049153.1 hypothetical protein [Nitrospira sp.]
MGIIQKIINWLTAKVTTLLTWDRDVLDVPPCDFARFRFELRLCDVILVEGRTRISDVIKTITLSCWTHAAIYIGRLDDIEDADVRNLVKSYHPGPKDEHLIIESLLGGGTIISPLSKYQYDNIRICRPKDLSPHDAQTVMKTAAGFLGCKYNTRQLLDLARFMFPYGILPRRWRSSLFNHMPGQSTRTICSTMLVEAFSSAKYPVLPVRRRASDDSLTWFHRNTNLFTPRDFDYSPFFEIIKFPFVGHDMAFYRNLPWDKKGVIYNDEAECAPDDPHCSSKKENLRRRFLPRFAQKASCSKDGESNNQYIGG